MFFYLLHVWQLVPKYPAAQMHVYVLLLPVTWHVAPFKQGLLKQTLTL